MPKDAHVVLEDDSIETRPVADLQVGDLIRVQAGENVPADGTIQRGKSRVNEALVTGESKPIEKIPEMRSSVDQPMVTESSMWK